MSHICTIGGRRYILTTRGLTPYGALGTTTTTAMPDPVALEAAQAKAVAQEAKSEADSIMEELAGIATRLRKL